MDGFVGQEGKRRIRNFIGVLGVFFFVGLVYVLSGLNNSRNISSKIRDESMPGNTKSTSIKNYLPYGEVFSDKEMSKYLSQHIEKINYLGEAKLDFPVFPFTFFALRYEEDIVIETNHPEWSMHEFARILLNGREIWLAKDSDLDGLQTVTADIEDIETWSSEIPVPRKSSKVDVTDLSTEKKLDIRLKYTNPNGENVEMNFSSPRPPSPNPKSNGPTFNHSKDFVAPLLDISGKQIFSTSAQMTFDGVDYGIRKVLGIIPVKVLLNQTQGGFARANHSLKQSGDGVILLERPIPGETWNTKGVELWKKISGGYSFENGTHRFEYFFNQQNEFTKAKVFSIGFEKPSLEFLLSAPLPNLSRHFSGIVFRNFVMKINGKNQGGGEIQVISANNQVKLNIIPEKPFWFRERPMEYQIEIISSEARAEIRGEMTSVH